MSAKLSFSIYPVFVFVLFLMFSNINAQEQFPYRNLSTNSGLSHPRVLSSEIDSTGLIWVGTEYGLNVYNGHEFKTYTSTPDDDTSLTDNKIESLFCDANNTIWVGTGDGVLHKYSREIDGFLHYDLASEHSKRTRIKKISEDGYGNLWIGYLDGLVKFNVESGKSTRYSNPAYPDTTGYLENFHIDQFGRFWVGYWKGGVYIFNPKNEEFTPYFTVDSYPNLVDASVMSIEEDKNHNLWMGSFNKGLIKINYPSSKITIYEHNKDDKNSLNSNKIKSLALDQNDNVWVGTEEAGLSLLRAKEDKFTHFLSDFQSDIALEGMSVYSIKFSGNDFMLIGTRENGIFLFNTSPSKFQFISRVQGFENEKLSISSLCEDGNSNLWAAISGDLGKVDTQKGVIVPMKLNLPESPNVIKFDGKDNIWIGGLKGGIYVFNTVNRRIRPIHKPQIKGEKITDFFFSRNHTVVSASRLFGKLEKNSGSFDFLNTDYGVPFFFSMEKGLVYLFERSNILISQTNEDSEFVVKDKIPYDFPNSKAGLVSDDYLYNGTDGGLFQIHKKDHTVKHLKKLPGNINYEVNSIFADSIKRIWFSTAKDVVCFDELKDEFRIYNGYNGVPNIRFRDNTGIQLKDGTIGFAGENGLVLFNPENFILNKKQPTIEFTNFTIGNKKYPESLNLLNFDDNDKITLAHNQNFFKVAFSLIDHEEPERILYKYRLEGFDDEWNENYDVRNMTYMNLPYGDYVFKVKGKNQNHQWSSTRSLKIEVLPPIWLRWYAYVAYFLIALGLLYLFHYYSTKQLRLSSALKQQRLELENLELIKKKENELHDLKIKFFTNISHEFKTPLTLIISPIEQYIETAKPISDQVLHQIYSNAVRLRQLILQVLDIRKIDQNKLKLDLTYGDIVLFTKNIATYFYQQAYYKDLKFEIIPHEQKLFTSFDSDKVEKILYNLLSNAIKFTKKGKVSFEIGKVVDENDLEWIEMTVSDTGIGISPKKINKIFKRFYQIKNEDNSIQGTGIGLSIVKDLVDIHEGHIDVQSTKEQGTKFLIRLPHKPKMTESVASIGLNGNASKVNGTKLSSDPNKKTILIIEDNPEMRAYLGSELKEDYNILFAENGKVGIEQSNNHNPDLIVSDIMMPEMDGFEFIERVKKDHRTSHIPVILTTALSDLEHQSHGYQTGADDYIVKPYNTNILKEKIGNIISSREKLKMKFRRDAYSKPEILKVASNDEKFLQKCYDFIEENLSNSEIDIDVFAESMATSRSQLYRKTKALTGLSGSEFIKTTRLKIAAKLIREKKYNVSEAAYAVGFKDPKYFSKCFHAQFGALPSKYKEEQLD